MGQHSCLLTSVLLDPSCCRNGGHEGSDEGHEGKEGDEEGLCPLGQAPRLLRQGVQDGERPQQGELDQEQGGKIVSKKASDRGKKSPWIKACQAARKALGIKGFAVFKKGSPLYKKAKELYRK